MRFIFVCLLVVVKTREKFFVCFCFVFYYLTHKYVGRGFPSRSIGNLFCCGSEIFALQAKKGQLL